jgi:hypothetical protein
MGEMVRESGAPEAKKSLAMNFVRASGKLANGSRGSVEAVCDAFTAQTPILLELYLERRVDAQAVEEAIVKHISNCPGQALRLRGDGGEMNWQRLAFAAISKATWPGVALCALVMYQEEIRAILRGVLR